MPMVIEDMADLFASRQGRASSGNADFGAITRDFGPKILRPANNFRKKFRGRKIFGPKSRAIARKTVPPDDNRTLMDANRSAMYLATIRMPRRAGLRAFFGAIRTEIKIKIVSRPQKVWSEIAFDCAEMSV